MLLEPLHECVTDGTGNPLADLLLADEFSSRVSRGVMETQDCRSHQLAADQTLDGAIGSPTAFRLDPLYAMLDLLCGNDGTGATLAMGRHIFVLGRWF